MEQSKLFQPIQIGPISLQHRIAMAPLTRLRADQDHVLLPMAVEYYSQRAAVPGTLIVAEASLISTKHGGFPNAPGMWAQEHIDGWKRVTDAVHARGCSIICQLVALGRAASIDELSQCGYDLISSSAVAMPDDGHPNPTPRAMTTDEVHECIDHFTQAARKAISAGFDGVEIHGANGYLVDQFLQDTCNNRTDDWGGTVEGRARFGIQIARAVAAAIGPHRVGFRISPWSEFQGMRMTDPNPQFTYLTSQLKSLKLGYLHIIESRVNNNVDCENTDSIEFLLDVWDNSSPVLLAGGYTANNARHAIDDQYRGYDVIVVFGRYFIANPDLPHRLKHDIPLNPYDRTTFYTPESPVGYIDYPYSHAFTAEHPQRV